MKKLLLISTVMLVSAGISFAGPNFDFSVGASPFQSLERARFEKESAEHWQNVKRSEEEYAEDRYQDADTSEIQRMKPKPQINIDSNRIPQMIEKDGAVRIEYR